MIVLFLWLCRGMFVYLTSESGLEGDGSESTPLSTMFSQSTKIKTKLVKGVWYLLYSICQNIEYRMFIMVILTFKGHKNIDKKYSKNHVLNRNTDFLIMITQISNSTLLQLCLIASVIIMQNSKLIGILECA